jgi:hypothetical protein
MTKTVRKHAGRKPTVPYIVGEIKLGFDHQREHFKLDGPLDSEMQKVIKKYGVYFNKQYAILCVIGWFIAASALVATNSLVGGM